MSKQRKKRPDLLTPKRKFSKRHNRWEYYFTRKAANGEKLPSSQMYRSRSGRNDAMNRIISTENAIRETPQKK